MASALSKALPKCVLVLITWAIVYFMASRALQLYRQLLRVGRSSSFPRPFTRKLQQNARLVFELHRQTRDQGQLEGLYGDAEAAVRVLKWLSGLEQVGHRPGTQLATQRDALGEPQAL